jgi:hypothetical protein
MNNRPSPRPECGLTRGEAECERGLSGRVNDERRRRPTPVFPEPSSGRSDGSACSVEGLQWNVFNETYSMKRGLVVAQDLLGCGDFAVEPLDDCGRVAALRIVNLVGRDDGEHAEAVFDLE